MRLEPYAKQHRVVNISRTVWEATQPITGGEGSQVQHNVGNRGLFCIVTKQIWYLSPFLQMCSEGGLVLRSGSSATTQESFASKQLENDRTMLTAVILVTHHLCAYRCYGSAGMVLLQNLTGEKNTGIAPVQSKLLGFCHTSIHLLNITDGARPNIKKNDKLIVDLSQIVNCWVLEEAKLANYK